MKIGQNVVRQSRLAVACIVFISTCMGPAAFAQNGYRNFAGDSSLLQVQKSSLQSNLFDELWPTDPPAKNGQTPSPSPTPNAWNGNTFCQLGNCDFPGTGTGTSGGYYPNSPYSNPWGYDPTRMDRAIVGQDYQCNLFENTPASEMLSSLNALATAVNQPGCQDANGQAIAAETKRVTDAVKSLRTYVDNPDQVTSDKAGEIAAAVDVAVQSTSSIASAFANTALSKDCRKGMNAGQIATSLNSVINGLTPFALMAAGVTGGTAAVPFIVGGAVLTGAITSISNIIDQNSIRIQDPLVRQAVLENTCQYIRLEQKYKFLIKSRKEQVLRISQEISVSQSMFSARVKNVDPAVNALLMRRNAIEQTSRELNQNIANVETQFQSDKASFNPSGNSMMACNFGIQIAKTTDDKTSYASVMLSSLDQAMAVYGKNSSVQASTLKANATMAVRQLKAYETKTDLNTEDAKNCTEMAKALVKTVEDSAAASKQLLRLAKRNVETELQKNKNFGMLRASIGAMDQKKIQADRVTDSLEVLRKYAGAITQSEINSSMDKIRTSLFARSRMKFPSPVFKWFQFTENLHTADVDKFTEGLTTLRQKAYSYTKSFKTSQYGGPQILTSAMLSKDRDDAMNLRNMTLKNLPLDTREHADACRELRNVRDRWIMAVDHLLAMNSFCALIEPYIYDSNPEDKELVAICRDDKREPRGKNGSSTSHIAGLKNKLITSYKRDWAMVVNRKINELVCLDPSTAPTGPIAVTAPAASVNSPVVQTPVIQ